jgi:hypothetical protein
MNITIENNEMFFSSLNGTEKVIYKAHRDFYINNGYSIVEAESEAYKKIQNVRKLGKRKDIIRY